MIFHNDKVWQEKLATIAAMEPGTLITHRKLDDLLGLSEPPMTRESPRDYMRRIESYRFARMAVIERLKHDLLEVHKIYLNNSRGKGFVLVPPDQQTELACSDCMHDLRRTFRRTNFIIRNVRQDGLTFEQRRRDADAVARLAQLQEVLLKHK